LVLLAVLAGCWMLDETYNPPPRSARMFPDVPPAIATLGAITAINLAVFVAWRIPPLWRTMNKTFQVTAAYPFAIGTLGSQFSHQSFRHLFVNMVMLWPFGWICKYQVMSRCHSLTLIEYMQYMMMWDEAHS
jgi:rhomboid-like protein